MQIYRKRRHCSLLLREETRDPGEGCSFIDSFCRGMNATTLEKAFCTWFPRLFPECSHNSGVCCGQWFQHAVLLRSRYSQWFQVCAQPPPPPTSFTLSNICKWTRSATGFVYNSFQLFFCQPVLRFLENMTQCFKWFKSCPNVFAF